MASVFIKKIFLKKILLAHKRIQINNNLLLHTVQMRYYFFWIVCSKNTSINQEKTKLNVYFRLGSIWHQSLSLHLVLNTIYLKTLN